ncbi:NADP-dependent oxidoreductase [Halieaceae bacterium IMCC14734]|uniref:NADP-dependent oxidoreductase n=1 Tax=Candidatus Litorirhabdus singularis TaxID=2518993 RepID=A0ABT3TDY6_9GAMM|nr:NADP-dependent oxidoreductase [Candidatus Litorirhabdus singularis]MCX2980511.1 NADP-dependent oxidoreductase [Candidatus Litorirhabdus singularis]
MQLVNQKVVLARRPQGMPTAEDFEFVEEPVAEPEPGQVVIEVDHLGIDAFIATTLDHDGHHGQNALQSAIIALGTGRIVASLNDDFAVDDWVFGGMGAQRYNVCGTEMLRKLDPNLAPPRSYLGVLGMTTGLTAYAGMLLVGQVKEGDTVAVSAAAGAVGTVACQLAKVRGANVIGIAGGPQKCEFLESIGCSGTIDYKNSDVASELKRLAPDGLNVFFDNVGGSILDAALDNLAMEARVVICGAISQYAHMAAVEGPSLYLRLAERNSSMRGFTVDHFTSQFPKMEADLAGWSAEGKVNLPEHIEQGLERFPDALGMLYSGGHTGKLLLKP